MTTKAIYEKGALHPLEPLSLAEGAQVEVIVRIPEVAAPEGVDAGARLAGDEGGAGARGGSAERRSACRARSRPLSLRSSSAAMTFADAGAWGAVAMEADENHDAASRWYYANRDRLFTTDYVVDETLTLWRAREAHRQAGAFNIFSG